MSLTESSDSESPTVAPSKEEVYQALLRSLWRRKGFGIVFVQCSPGEAIQLIQRMRQGLPQKKIEVLQLTQPTDNLYDLIANFPDCHDLNILLIQGIEKSLEPYIKPGYGGDGNYYILDVVPPILSHLNQRREKFRDDFSHLCFVFVLPFYAVKYLIRRAPDFFDWSAGVFELTTKSEHLESKSDKFLQLDNLDVVFNSLEEINQGIDFYQQQLAKSRETKDYEGEVDALIGLGSAYESLKEYEKAIAFYEQSLAIERKIDNRQGEAISLGYLSSAYDSLGEYEKAITFYEQSLAIEREIGNRQGEAISLGNLGSAYYSLGEYEKAIAFHEQSLAIFREIG
jgi:tetratricopeptide (TPR) repeat protein